MSDDPEKKNTGIVLDDVNNPEASAIISGWINESKRNATRREKKEWAAQSTMARKTAMRDFWHSIWPKVIAGGLCVITLAVGVGFYMHGQEVARQEDRAKARKQLNDDYGKFGTFDNLSAEFPGYISWNDDFNIKSAREHVQSAKKLSAEINKLSEEVEGYVNDNTAKIIKSNLEIYNTLDAYIADLAVFYDADGQINSLAKEMGEANVNDYRNYVARNKDKLNDIAKIASEAGSKVKNADLQDGLEKYSKAQTAVVEWAENASVDDSALSGAMALDTESDTSFKNYSKALQDGMSQVYKVKVIGE